MKKISIEIRNAFYNNESKKMSNTKTDGKAIYLFDNKIAEKREDGLYITTAGWHTSTTKERLNTLPGVSIQQKNYAWFLNGKAWDGNWIKI